MKTNQAIGILTHNIGLFSFLITNNDPLNCNILISLLPEGKSLKIASKQGFLAPGLEKWTKVVQARILVKNGRSSTPVWGAPQIVCSSILVQDSWRLQALFIRKMIWPCYNLVALQGVLGERGDNCDALFVKFVTSLPEACDVAEASDCG